MLKTHNLGGGYGGRPILSGVNIAIGEGDAVAVLGANTAGKTTLIKALAGLLPEVTGAVMFAGTDITRVPARACGARHRPGAGRPPRVSADDSRGQSPDRRLSPPRREPDA
jgi:ABC-type branched-subunit amino acid transport system ATPase component